MYAHLSYFRFRGRALDITLAYLFFSSVVAIVSVFFAHFLGGFGLTYYIVSAPAAICFPCGALLYFGIRLRVGCRFGTTLAVRSTGLRWYWLYGLAGVEKG